MTDESIYFFDLEEPYGCLSNFSRHQIYVDGTYWPTVEHYYQASKFEDPEHRRLVLHAETPTLAKRRGKSRKRPLRRDWNDIKIDVMRKSLRAKSHQHADVRAVLLATVSARLVQRTDADAFWGDGKKREGRNMLGKLWMEARDRLTEPGGFDELARPLPPPWEKYPDILDRKLEMSSSPSCFRQRRSHVRASSEELRANSVLELSLDIHVARLMTVALNTHPIRCIFHDRWRGLAHANVALGTPEMLDCMRR